jgi:hypothetical protein
MLIAPTIIAAIGLAVCFGYTATLTTNLVIIGLALVGEVFLAALNQSD